MIGIELGELLYKLTEGLHAGKGSEAAAGVANPSEWHKYGQPTKALHMSFDIRVSLGSGILDKYKSANASCSLHYLFNRPYGSNGFATTHTFAAVMDSPFAKVQDVKEWEFLSSHDSCWKDAARERVWQLERALYKSIAEEAGFKDEDKIPYNRLNWHISFPIFNSCFYQWVDVQIEKDPTDKHSYKKVISVLKGVSRGQTESSGA